MGTWLKPSAHVTVTVQFMKHCTQYLFPLHSREKPVPYQWMHTVHLCLNTEVRGKQTVRASHVCSAAPFSSTRPVCTSSVDYGAHRKYREITFLQKMTPCFSSFVLFKEENAGTSLTLVTFKKKIKVFMQSHDV